MSSKAREKFGWCMYDWANSAFATTILAAVLPVYFAEGVVPEQGVELALGGARILLSATSLWGYASGLIAFLILVSAPVMGSIADFTQRKKDFLMAFCYSGSLVTALLYFSGPGDVFYTLLLFCIAHYCFVGGNVFYDAFLPFFGGGKEMDSLSGKGFALGYLGGGLLLALNLVFVQLSTDVGIQKATAVRLSLLSAGIWWGLFGTISFLLFGEERSFIPKRIGFWTATVRGWRQTLETTKKILQSRQILLFLIAYMIYNDGVQTVIKMASIYGKDELCLPTSTLLGTLLMVQFLGIGGTLVMSRFAQRLGARQTIMVALLLWLGLSIFAFTMDSSLEYWLLGIVVALILGGTQALSRSLYGRLIPRSQSAQYYGFFSIFAKFSAIWGPIAFAFIRQVTGTARLSILSLSLFFLTGFILLIFVNDRESWEYMC